MQRFSHPQIKQIHTLRKSGLAFKKISKILQISPSTVFKYSADLSLSQKALNLLEQNQTNNQQKFVLSFAKEKTIQISKLNKNFANLLGHLFFDGSVHYCSGKFVLSYTNSSKKNIFEFIKNLNLCFNLRPSKIYSVKGKPTNWFIVQAYSKKAYLYLKSISESYSTSENARIPNCIMISTFPIKTAFLRAFWDDEGCISNDGVLVGSSNSENMIEDLITLHLELGIECKKNITKPENREPHYRIVIKNTSDNFHEFIEKIGFQYAIVTRGYNIGKYKKAVLAEKFNQKYKKLSVISN